ncbi:MAG: DUF6529 family protein [Actinomycetota bacterium]
MIASILNVTDGLLLVKSVGATIVFVLAGSQVLLAARFTGAVKFGWMRPSTANRIHKMSGRVAIVLAVVVAALCIAGPAGATSPTRVALHSIFGALVFAILALKFLLLRVLRKGEKYMPSIGSAVFLTFGAIWITSVADFAAGR